LQAVFLFNMSARVGNSASRTTCSPQARVWEDLHYIFFSRMAQIRAMLSLIS